MPIDISRFEQLKASGDLPSPKGIALAVIRLTQQERMSLAELAALIRSDPAFVGRLIKAANDIIGYGRRPVASIGEALNVLGVPAVRAMALGFSLLNNYRSGACEGFDYRAFWGKSLLTAVTMQTVALRTRVVAPDESYCLGLLARVGQLALATLYPHDYSRICQEAGSDPLQLLEHETRAFAMNSAELGAAMLADWGLPRLFCDAAFNVAILRAGHHGEGTRQAALEYSLSFARIAGGLCNTTEQDCQPLRWKLLTAGSCLGFDEETVSGMIDTALLEWSEWGVLLDVATDGCSPFQSKEEGPELPASALPADDEGVSASQRASDGMRVLLVEADPSQRASLRAYLLKAGYEVAEATDGFSATETALDFRPDMMLLGWSLPDVSGLEMLASLRRTRIGRAIYIVLLTLSGDEETTIAAFDGGADDILSLPVSERLLLARLEAGKRISSLQYEIEQDREEIRRFAAELAVSNRRLQEVALTDSLTGFPNRRCFVERLEEIWSATQASNALLACIVIDIDRFKGINDAHGHEAGDKVLRAVSVAIRSSLRSSDLLARLGGDEFVVLCPGLSLEAAQACAERIRRAVIAVDVTAGPHRLKPQVSLGVACRDRHTPDADALVRQADQSLYRAKQAGRNRVSALQAGE
ncbi:diguanylate cyclase [Uliginosibacterium paludis]|uniref:diguanylate cyclase n=1 Tax=Uliginosibacterium paludis TaxID=1615952 RepID=A0ABV2CUF1_9RHOO